MSSSRKPQSMSALNTSPDDDLDSSPQKPRSMRVRSSPSSSSSSARRTKSNVEDTTSTLTDTGASERTSSRRVNRHRNNSRSSSNSSLHSRTSIGSLDDIDELVEANTEHVDNTTGAANMVSRIPSSVRRTKTSESDGDSASLSRARDRLRTARVGGGSGSSSGLPPTPATPSTSSRSLGGTGRRTLPDSLIMESNSFEGNQQQSSSHSRRRPPRQTRSNDSIGHMAESVMATATADTSDAPSSSRSLRSTKRSTPARSFSSNDARPLSPVRKSSVGGNSNPASTTTATSTTSNSATSAGSGGGGGSSGERGRSSNKKKPEGSSRSRSRSKGARKKPASSARLAQAISSANSQNNNAASSTTGDAKRDSSSGDGGDGAPTTVSSTSTRVRKKTTSGSNSLGGGGGASTSLAGLSMLDDLSPRARGRGPRDTRSVGPELMSPPGRSAPQRKVIRTRSQDAGGISSLAAFLNTSSKSSSKPNKMSGSRSVGAVPTVGGSSSSSAKKPLRRRLKKGGGDGESVTSHSQRTARSAATGSSSHSRPKVKGHASLGSGLDLHSASSAPMEGYGGSKRGRKPGSSSKRNETLDDGSLHMDDLLQGGSKQKNGSGGALHRSISGSNSQQQGARLNRSMGDIMGFKASDLGSLLAQQKEIKRRTGGAASVVSELMTAEGEQQQQQEDIFSTYSWTTSRQDRIKVLDERKLLNETLRQGSFESAYQSYVGN